MLAIGSFHLPSILLSLFSWGSLYFTLRRLQPQRKAEWHCRTVTAVHASLISLITAWSTFVQGPWPFTDAGKYLCRAMFCSLAYWFNGVGFLPGHFPANWEVGGGEFGMKVY